MFRSSSVSNFVVLVENSDTGGPSSTTVRIEYLFAFQIWCCKLCVENRWVGGRKHFVDSLFFKSALIIGKWGLVEWGRKSHLGPGEIASFYSCFFFANWLNLRARGRYLIISTGNCLIISHNASPIHPVEEFIPLFPVLLKEEMRMLRESKVLSFCIWY